NEIKKEEQLYLQQTCENPATYYQICSRCDEISQQQTFTVGEPKPHNWIEDEDRIVLVSGATCQNLAKYEKVCSMCKFYPSDYDLEGEEYYFTYGGFADHSFTREVTEEKYFNAPASCTQKATYFYSCACGAKGSSTFETGEMEEHNFVLEVMEEKFLSTSATCDKKASYFYSCKCGEKGTRTFETGDYVHNYNLQNTDAIYFSAHSNCNQKATYFYSCKCGAKGTETFEFGAVGDHDFANNQPCTVCQASYGLKYDMAEDNSGYIVSLGNCKDKNIVIPRYYNKTPVISIGDAAFKTKTITGITIPDGIISIGQEAFYNCTKLTSITIPGSVITIGDKAFYGCSSLASLTISNGVTNIGNSAFRNCSALKSVTIPDSVTEIGKWAFQTCTNLKSIIIGKGVKNINSNAFNGCNALEKVYYVGTSVGWSGVEIKMGNDLLIDATRYYFSETKPAVMGNYWHYDTDGKTPILW
ncbi:MAG: leucine-rich repeat domain-containing protein, partial [Clostridia bacterium]|nr:leucine-rich repeat domain-containing protein [Clostridia bacterium]